MREGQSKAEGRALGSDGPDRFCSSLREDDIAEVSRDATIPHGRRAGARDNKPMEATASLNL
jgi:hypothetical protein